MQEIQQTLTKLLELNTQILKLSETNFRNKRTETYNQNKKYESYEDEIISGENVIDCIDENIKRKEFLLKKYEEFLIQINQIRNKIIKQIQIEIKEQENNFEELQDTINKLNKIVEIEKEKEIKNDKEEIEKIQKEKKTI